MHAIVSNAIRIERPTPQCRARYVELLTFANPEYAKKERMGLWLGNTPRVLSLMKSGMDWIEIPFGMLGDVFAHRTEYDGIENRVKIKGEQFDYMSTIKPYDYQEKAIQEALRVKNGVVVAPCGSGKTQIGLEIIARLGLRALWLTHTGDLLKQSMERAKSVFDIDPKTYGTITEGRIDIGQSITFATVQTMCRIDLEEVKNEWDVIVVDEAHHIVGTPTKLQMFYKVVSKLCARYKFGLTATPKRSDGLIACMYSLLGEKIYEISASQVKENLCPVRIFMRDVQYTPDFNVILAPDGTLQYTNLITDIIRDSHRNEQIVDDIARASIHKKGIILTDRVEHAEILHKMFSEKYNFRCSTLHGNTSKRVRQNILKCLEDGEVDLIIATFALAKEGLDVPSLDNVFFVTPQKNETIVVQSAGRVARKHSGKQWGNVYDYVDNFGMLRGWANKRKGYYKKFGYIIAQDTSI